ncbi:MAG: flavin-containing monooxygenase [Rhizomicrobium sp.]
MQSTDVAIIGAGQAGLAASRCLSVLGIEHVVFERGDVAERWKTTTWNSLRALTPNWMNGLPWQPYAGDDPHGFMSRDEIVAMLQGYSGRHRVPVVHGADVLSVQSQLGTYSVVTTNGTWRARALIIATGYCDLPFVPYAEDALPSQVVNLHSSQYRSPGTLPPGGVLVVGASASGIQIARELRLDGREVVLAVGRHTRLPRLWRGHDIFWWLTRLGKLKERPIEMRDRERAIGQPSLQLVGRPDRASVDLFSLQTLGIRLAGRIRSVGNDVVHFRDDLRDTVTKADAKLERVLREIDAFAGLAVPGTDYVTGRVDLSAAIPTSISLGSEGLRTVIWATGFKRAYPWLRLPVVDASGELEHRDGITRLPGVYALGLRFLRKRDSNFIGGVGTDAWEIAADLAGFLGHYAKTAA